MSVVYKRIREIGLSQQPTEREMTSSSSAIVPEGRGIIDDPLNIHNPNPYARGRAKHWIMTLWNQTEEEVTEWYHKQEDYIESIAACKDIAPTTGEFHIHVAVSFKQRIYFTTLQSWFGRENHFEAMKGKVAAYTYVLGRAQHGETKEIFLDINSPQGSIRQQQRVKKDRFWSKVQKMTDVRELDELLQQEEYANYIGQAFTARRWLAMKCDIKRIREHDRAVVWIYGARGDGKSFMLSTFSDQHMPTGECSFSLSSGQLICNKEDPKTCVFDDIDLKHVNKTLFFNLIDQYNITADKKLSIQTWRPDYVIITSIISPFELDQGDLGWNSNEKEQVVRRLKLVIRAYHDPMTGERQYEYSQVQRNQTGNYVGTNPQSITFEEALDLIDTSAFN